MSLVLINSHCSADYAHQVSPLFVDVGGMANWQEEKELPEDFQELLDSANDGAIMITFGSTVLLNTVSERHQKIFFDVIQAFPKTKFILRWETPPPKFLEDIPKNLKFAEWVPQREILRHPNLKCFLTRGGISSIHAAAYYAVPLIVLPLFSDQDMNAYRVHNQQLGIRVEIRGITNTTLASAVEKILSEEKYKVNMLRKSAIFKDQTLSPVKTALFRVEFVLRHYHTADTFRLGNTHLNWFQRERLDIFAFIFISVVVIAIVTLKIILCLKRSIVQKRGSKLKTTCSGIFYFLL